MEKCAPAKHKRERMTIISYNKCPLCKSSAIKKRFACVDNFATKESFDIHECEDCGFVFTHNFPDEKEIDRYYESPSYISHSNTDKGLVNSMYHLVRKIMLRKKARLVERCSLLKRGKLLDYGAGTGYFARTMAARGWDVTAIEKNGKARELALEEFGFGMHPVEALAGIKEKELDVVTMWHVMEHIQDLDKMWNELRRVLCDNGTAIIAVPNCTSYDAQKYKEHWAAYDTPRHLWHFTPDTMEQWGKKHGFTLDEKRTMPFDGFYISMLSEQNMGSRMHTIKGFWNGFKGWMAQMKRADAASSIIYVFRKRDEETCF